MQYGFHFNGRRCTGCKTCVLACKDFHDLPSDIAFRQVYEYGGGTWRRADDGTVTQDTFAYHLSVACNHCGNAACVRVCPTGAMHKDERGLVRVDADRCIGCGYCALSCPYRAPKVDRVAGRSAKCDGCAERVAEGTVADVPPLPAVTATAPNLVVSPPRIFKDDPGRVRAEGRVQNAREIV